MDSHDSPAKATHVKAHIARQRFELAAHPTVQVIFKIINLLNECHIQSFHLSGPLKGCRLYENAPSARVTVSMSGGYLSLRFLHATHKREGGGPVTNIPINSRQSGNRRVNLEGLGCGGGNESVKGSIVPSSHLALPFLPPRIHSSGRPRGKEEGEKGRFPPQSLALENFLSRFNFDL